ncbi:MAG: DUF983 domain-containing protein [Candidatus Rokuibacteriota bacterium]
MTRAVLVARRALSLRCPRCGDGALFRGWFAMAPECTLCGLTFERAQGYFVGAIYLNYAATVTLAVGGYLVLWTYTGLPTTWQLAIWMPFCVLFPLWFFRYSRSLWLAVEYFVNPEI